jgi:hypothetical protein
MSLLVSSADASAYRSRLKRVSLSGKRRFPLLDADQRVDFIQKLEVVSNQPEEIATQSLSVLTPVDPELAGDGQYFCPWCARHFISAAVLAEHEKSKTHKKRRKDVIAEGNTLDQELISEMAVGFTRETKKPRQQ